MAIKSIQLEKLIRDQLPKIMELQGTTLHTRILVDDELVQRLKEKLLEEAKEVHLSENLDELTEELADVLEVIHALSKASGVSMQAVENKRIEKRHAKGGFDAGIFVERVEMEESNPAIKFFYKNDD